jgi:hypothetical protein
VLKLYQYQVLAGFLLAVAAVAPVASAFGAGPQSILEAASFLLCCAGIMTGGRAVRSAFEKHGRDKVMAARDPQYMELRKGVQFTSTAAVGAIGLLLAKRYDVPWFAPLAGAALLAVILPVINRAFGWD